MSLVDKFWLPSVPNNLNNPELFRFLKIVRDQLQTGSPASYNTIQEEGTALTQRRALNFVGGGLTAADDSSNGRTNITLQSPLLEANGGTGESTYTKGDILYANTANSLTKLPIGTNSQILKIVSGLPSWQADAGGTVDGSGAANRIAFWSDSDTLSSDANFTYVGGLLTLSDRQIISPTHTASTQTTFEISPVWNHSSIHTALLINPTNSSSSTSSRLLRAQLGGTDRLVLTRRGELTLSPDPTVGQVAIDIDGTLTATSQCHGLRINQAWNPSSGAPNHRAIWVNISSTTGVGTNAVIFGSQVAGSSRFTINVNGCTEYNAAIATSTQTAMSINPTFNHSSTHNGLHLNITNTLANDGTRCARFTETRAITGNITDGYIAGLTMTPTYNGDSGTRTVTRHNFFDLTSPAVNANAAVTDACVFRFGAAAGTHKAVDSGSTKTTPETVDAWMKININGTVYYMPCYTSKTS